MDVAMPLLTSAVQYKTLVAIAAVDGDDDDAYLSDMNMQSSLVQSNVSLTRVRFFGT